MGPASTFIQDRLPGSLYTIRRRTPTKPKPKKDDEFARRIDPDILKDLREKLAFPCAKVEGAGRRASCSPGGPAAQEGSRESTRRVCGVRSCGVRFGFFFGPTRSKGAYLGLRRHGRAWRVIRMQISGKRREAIATHPELVRKVSSYIRERGSGADTLGHFYFFATLNSARCFPTVRFV